MSLKLSGILSANVTPFKDNYDLDEAGLRKLIRYQAKPAGINAIVCNAGAGEGATLTREERVRCVEIIREEIRQEQHVVAGIEALSTREAIQQTREAKAAGAAAIMLTPPHVGVLVLVARHRRRLMAHTAPAQPAQRVLFQ